MEFKGEDDVIGILTELADKPFSPTEWAALDVSNRISEHRTQVPHFHTTLDLHTRKKLMRDASFAKNIYKFGLKRTPQNNHFHCLH